MEIDNGRDREEMGEKPSHSWGRGGVVSRPSVPPPQLLSFNLVLRSQLSSVPLPSSSARCTQLSPADAISYGIWLLLGLPELALREHMGRQATLC